MNNFVLVDDVLNKMMILLLLPLQNKYIAFKK